MEEQIKIFKPTWFFKLLMIILFLFMILIQCILLLVVVKHYLFALVVFASLIFTIVGCLIMITEKTLVTTNKIVNVNMFKKQIIPFRMVRRVYSVRGKNGLISYVSTTESNIRLCGLSDKRQEKMQKFILETIHENDPEHFKLINLPKYEVEDFWRK